MKTSEKLLVSITRQVPYDELTVEEKLELVKHSPNQRLLVALATDDSLEVRRSLLDTKAQVPDMIFGEYLMKDKNKEVSAIATKKLQDKLSKFNEPVFGTKLKRLLVFLCNFFSTDFISTLDTHEGKKKAMSALYLYEIKYGFTQERSRIFEYEFANNYSRAYVDKYYTLIGAQTSYEPWSLWLWINLGQLANYKYFPKEMEEILNEREYFQDEEIENIVYLKHAIRLDTKYYMNWINIVASTLFNAGSLECSSKLEREYQILYLSEKSRYGLEDIYAAQRILEGVYSTSHVETCYNKKKPIKRSEKKHG